MSDKEILECLEKIGEKTLEKVKEKHPAQYKAI